MNFNSTDGWGRGLGWLAKHWKVRSWLYRIRFLQIIYNIIRVHFTALIDTLCATRNSEIAYLSHHFTKFRRIFHINWLKQALVCSMLGRLSPGFFSADSPGEASSLDAAASLADEMWSLVRFGWVGDALSGAGTHDGYHLRRI